MRHFIQFIFILMTGLFLTLGSSTQAFSASRTLPTATDQKPVTDHLKGTKNPAIKPDAPVKSDIKSHMQFKPDLIIKTMKIWPANPTTLDTIRFSAYVKNTKLSTAPPSKAGIKFGGETYPVLYAKPEIKGGASTAIVRLKQVTKSGTYWVKFIADVDNDVEELNENNNMGSLKFTVVDPPLPDLTVVNITNNSNNCLVYTLKNIGGPIPSSVNRNLIGIRFTKDGIIGYSISNLQIADPNCNLCQPNGTVTATLCNPGSTIGQWYDSIHVLVKVDFNNKLTESNESNNEMEELSLTSTSPYGG